MTYDHILQAIGQTPLVRLNKVVDGLRCSLFAKCEFLNPGGSVKDRIAQQMVEKAEKEGRIQPGATLIEPTSGNTGIGLALAGAVKGYHVVITMPDKMSHEKQVVLEALGAVIYRTPSEVDYDDPRSHISLAYDLERSIPNAHILDQYNNEANPGAHFEHTGREIIEDLPDLAMAVIGVGTGGTITGTARYLKSVNPDIKIVGVDPNGSILAGGEQAHSYYLEGIGYDFIPDVLDNTLVDRYIKVNDAESFHMARRLIREEGLLVGGSAGAAVVGAMEAAKDLTENQKCAVILPDGIRNYMSKFVDDNWLQQHQLVYEGEHG